MGRIYNNNEWYLKPRGATTRFSHELRIPDLTGVDERLLKISRFTKNSFCTLFLNRKRCIWRKLINREFGTIFCDIFKICFNLLEDTFCIDTSEAAVPRSACRPSWSHLSAAVRPAGPDSIPAPPGSSCWTSNDRSCRVQVCPCGVPPFLKI